MKSSSKSRSGDWPLLTSLGIGLAVWATVLAFAQLVPAVDEALARSPRGWGLGRIARWAAIGAHATIAAHLAFTASVSFLSWIAGPWRPLTGRGEDARIAFLGTSPPRLSWPYGFGVALVLLDHFHLRKLFEETPDSNFPFDRLRLLVLASLVAGAAWLWGRWLVSVGRLHDLDGDCFWSDRSGTQNLDKVLVSRGTVIGANRESAVVIRLPGGLEREAWRPNQSVGEPAWIEGYRKAKSLEPEGHFRAFFATWDERVALTSEAHPAATLTIGGHASRWSLLLLLTLVYALFASRVVFAFVGSILLIPALGLTYLVIKPLLMTDAPWRRGGVVDDEWLWKQLDHEPPREMPIVTLLFAQHLADSTARRIGAALLFAGLWLLVASAWGAALLLTLTVLLSNAWFLPLTLLPTAILWITMTSYRLRVRIKEGLLAMRIGGAWLPVTRVDAEGDAIVLSAGPLRVLAREHTSFRKARDPSVTASLIWPFCAPASAFSSSPRTERDRAGAHARRIPDPCRLAAPSPSGELGEHGGQPAEQAQQVTDLFD